MRKLGIYIHIPFCVKKCNYCDFYSLPHDSIVEASYINALCKHIKSEKHLYENYEVDTVYIGGGTPSVLSLESIKRIADTVRVCFNLAENMEFSIEQNPCTMTEEKLALYKSVGINRLSIGAQSMNDDELKCLGRAHTSHQVKEKFQLARKCGFENISLDVMFGLPNQRLEDFQKTLDQVCLIAPEHISAYGLKIEENTNFGRIKETLCLPTDEQDYEMYSFLCDTLSKNGYEQYEISNFAKKGYSSRHNMKYWLCEEYVGFGSSAHSCFQGVRYFYENDIQKYISEEWEKICESLDDTISDETDKMDEYVMLRLRLSEGVDELEFEKAFGKTFLSEYPQIGTFVLSGHIKKDKNRYFFTKDGFFVSNYILSSILH